MFSLWNVLCFVPVWQSSVEMSHILQVCTTVRTTARTFGFRFLQWRSNGTHSFMPIAIRCYLNISNKMLLITMHIEMWCICRCVLLHQHGAYRGVHHALCSRHKPHTLPAEEESSQTRQSGMSFSYTFVFWRKGKSHFVDMKAPVDIFILSINISARQMCFQWIW